MLKIARRLSAARTDRETDAGFSIIEVLVAALIFMLLSVGIAQATVTSIRLSGDQKHRVTALSLAASEIDRVRALADPFNVLSDTSTVTIDGITYTVTRAAQWVSGTGTDIPCGGAGTANLQVKRVNVSVTWAGQLAATNSVNSDTVLAPVGRINDPTQGTIIVSATRADGSGASGVTPTVTPVSGGATALTTAPPATDSDGCSYALRVTPGVYSVSLSKSGYVDINQQATPTLSVTVVAGATTSAPFAYDQAARFAMTYAPGAPSGTRFASNGEISFVNTYGTSVSGTPTIASLYPWAVGYVPIAGHYIAPTQLSEGCRSVDPSEWAAGTIGGGGPALAAGDHGAPVAAGPGGSAAMTVKMGLLSVRSSRNGTLIVSSATPIPGWGDPGCGTAMSYNFGSVSRNTDVTIALPFGTWTVSVGSGSLNLTPLNNVTPGLVSGNTVMLDPRPAA
ncbi:MAG TPA: type II secretion system protein [Pseudolysinimonas sp.]|nr:type II secretion system protein [Pseudolysinimonas sp.]